MELKAVGFKGPNAYRKHADVLIRIRQISAKQITLIEKSQFQIVSKNMGSKSLGTSAFKQDKVLSFGPTLIGDIMNNYNHHAKLDQKFNYKQFAVDSAKNQTGNAVEVLGGFAFTKAAVAVFGIAGVTVAGAPLILIGLGAGVLIAAGYNMSSAPDRIGEKAKILFGVDHP